MSYADRRRPFVSAVALFSWLAAVGTAQEPPVNPNARAVAEFQLRVKEYVALQQEQAGRLPDLPKAASPQEIDKHQRDLGALLVLARSGAKQGDIFAPEIQVFVRHLLATLFAKEKAAQLRASIMDENPMSVKIVVNGRYPDEVPLSTMPPQVLRSLPQLPEELEYRFVRDNLVMLDVRAHMIVDFIPAVLPK